MIKELECVRMLGFRNTDIIKAFFKITDERSDIKLTANPAKDKESFNKATVSMIDEDLFAASLYNNTSCAKSGKQPQNDCSRKLIIV